MAILFGAGRFKATDKTNDPVAGAFLTFYATLTSTLQPVYADSDLATPLTNPVKADANGLFPEIWLDDALPPYKVVHSSPDTAIPTTPGAIIWTISQYNSTLSSDALLPLINQITIAERQAGVTIVDYSYSQGHLYRYGTNSQPGTTDMTQAVNAWLSVGGDLKATVPETVLVNGTFNLSSNTDITLGRGVTFKNPTAGVSFFKATGKSNISIRGGTLQQTANSAAVHIGIIELNGCSDCSVENVEIIGAQWGGILLSGSSKCVVSNNNIHDSLGCTISDIDSHDIACYGNSSFNVIDGNICYGGLTVEHGIMIQDPGSGTLPLKNIVTNNRVGPHKSYGILNYMITHANTWNQITDNEVEGITGTGQSGNSGSGIYNQGAGGTTIANNTVRNCCINTSAFSLIPAGICMNLDAALEPVNCVGNHVSDIVNGSACISVTTGAANIDDNVIVQSAGMTTNLGIDLNTASNVKATGNHVTMDPTIASSQGILSLAGANVSNINISCNHVLGCAGVAIRVDTSASFTSTNVVISGNNTSSSSANCIALQLNQIRNGSVSGNTFSTVDNVVLSVTASQQVSYTGNIFSGGVAAPQVSFAGTCTGSYFDKSNILGTFVDNTATGQICEVIRSATPSSSYHSAVGDKIVQQVPVVGNPKGWRCTVAGNPGTWVSEGNL